MMRGARIVGIGVLLCGIAAGCVGKADPVAPGTALTGVWVGAVDGGGAATGTVRLVLTQMGAGVSGTFETSFPDVSLNRSGAAGGTILGDRLTVTLTPGTAVVCSASITLTGAVSAVLTIAGDRMTGPYTAFTCGGAVAGTVDVHRE
jgi:hypothetical protein